MSINVVSDAEWVAARLALLTEEKALSKATAIVAQKRAQLPWRLINDYKLIGPTGETSISQLFGDQDQLIVYHMMMGKGATQGCSLCSFFLDQFMGGLPHLLPKTNFVVVAKTEYPNLVKFAASKSNWDSSLFFSANACSFNEDFQVTFTAEQIENNVSTYNYNRLWKFGTEAVRFDLILDQNTAATDT